MKFHITDEDGKTCVVEELEEEKETKDEEPSEEIILSKEDILALKSLIPHIEKIKALVVEKEEEKEEVEDDEEEKEIVGEEVEEEMHENDDEEEIDEDENEEIIDTDEDREEGIHDSIGAINKKKNVSANDAFDTQVDIATAWSKRYNGGNE